MKLSKSEIFKVLSSATLEDVKEISKLIYGNYDVKVIKPAHKTLVMAKVREPINSSLFYLGEILACECMVEVNKVQGIAVIKGDDFAKTEGIAVIDAAVNANIQTNDILDMVLKLKEKQLRNRSILNAQIMKSKVSFSVMNQD